MSKKLWVFRQSGTGLYLRGVVSSKGNPTLEPTFSWVEDICSASRYSDPISFAALPEPYRSEGYGIAVKVTVEIMTHD